MPVRCAEKKEIHCPCGEMAELRVLIGTLGQIMTVTRCTNRECRSENRTTVRPQPKTAID